MFNVGTLHLKPKEANLTHDTQFLFSMNPFCVFVLGENKVKTEIAKGGGKHPRFHDHIKFYRTIEDVLDVEVWDRGSIQKNKLVGVGQLLISKLIKLGGSWKTPITLYFKKKIAGHIYIDIKLEREKVDRDAFKAYVDDSGTINLALIRPRRLGGPV